MAKMLTVALLLVAAAPTFASPQVRDLPPPAPAPTGTGRITGQVVAADNGAPVKRAQVGLTGSMLIRRDAAEGVASGVASDPSGASLNFAAVSAMVRKQAETDQSGRFEFTGLPAGQFFLMVSPATGFASSLRSETVRLADGESASVTLKLPRAGAITGRVLDEYGEPLERVRVRAMRRDSTTGARMGVAGMGGFATTDDLGQFRLYGLPAGDYYVAGTYEGMQTMPLVDQRTDNSPRMGYGPTYYPGSATVEGARRVTVRSGQDTGGIEFTLQRVPLARVLGTAYDSAGRPLAGMSGIGGASVMISSREEPGGSRGSSPRPDGTFVITDVTPGDYYVWASLTRGVGQDAEREAGWVPVTVNGGDVTVNIQTNVGATLSGRVIVEGGNLTSPTITGSAANSPRTTISVRPDSSLPSFGGFSTRPAQVAEDGTFELKGLRGGVILVPSGSRAILKSVSRAAEDVTGKSMMLRGTERITDLVIVMTTDTASLQGVVADSRGEPAPGVWVVIFPDDPDRWFAGSPFVVTTRTLASVPPVLPQRMTATPVQPLGTNSNRVIGGFIAPRLLPGRYWVAVLGDGNAMPSIDRESLEKLRPTATGVTVTAGEAATVQLRMPK